MLPYLCYAVSYFFLFMSIKFFPSVFTKSFSLITPPPMLLAWVFFSDLRMLGLGFGRCLGGGTVTLFIGRGSVPYLGTAPALRSSGTNPSPNTLLLPLSGRLAASCHINCAPPGDCRRS